MGELIVNGIKVAFWLALAIAFATAINALFQLFVSVVFANVIGEFFGLVSCFLPFNGAAVFSAFGSGIAAILSFLIAQKIYDLGRLSPLGTS